MDTPIGAALRLLSLRYGRLPRFGSEPFPLRLFPLPAAAPTTLDNLVQLVEPEPLLPSIENRLPRRTGLFNGPVLALHRFSPRRGFSLQLRPARYFEMLDSCDALEVELLSHGFSSQATALEGNLNEPLPWRDAADSACHRKPWLIGRGRAAAIGVSTLVAWRESAGWHILLGRLGPKAVPHRRGAFHVAPAGMLTPPGDIRSLIAEELHEELGWPEIPSGAHLRLTGLSFNLLNLRPEICTLLVLAAPPPPLRLAPSEYDGPPCLAPFHSPAQLVHDLHLNAGSLTPPAAGALSLAWPYLQGLNRATNAS